MSHEVRLRFQGDTGWSNGPYASAAAIWGYAITPADQAQIVELITGIGGIIGGVLALYGRIVATRKIT